jgi:hypothetical protein
MREVVSVFGPFVFLGGFGLVLGAIVGFGARRWRRIAVLVVVGLLVAVLGLSQIEDDPDDDDPGLAYAIAAVSNFAGWTVGLVAGAALRRR